MAETMFVREKKDRDYTVINNTFLRDSRLSWQAKGVFTYLLSLPEDWTICMSEIETHASNGRDSLRRCIKELKVLGYLEHHQSKNGGKFSTSLYKIIENPCAEKSDTELPLTEKPLTENPKLLNTNIQSTDKLNTNIQSTDKQICKETSTKNRKRTSKEPKIPDPYYKDVQEVYAKYLDNYEVLFKKGLVQNPIPAVNYAAVNKQVKKNFDIFGVEAVKKAIDTSIQDSWVISIGYPLNVILSEKMLPKYINGFVSQQKGSAFTEMTTDYSSQF
jgi:hypothetical protein